jgi:hypothetical protein
VPGDGQIFKLNPTSCEEVISGIRGVEAILLFGPGEAKGELKKRIDELYAVKGENKSLRHPEELAFETGYDGLSVGGGDDDPWAGQVRPAGQAAGGRRPGKVELSRGSPHVRFRPSPPVGGRFRSFMLGSPIRKPERDPGT